MAPGSPLQSIGPARESITLVLDVIATAYLAPRQRRAIDATSEAFLLSGFKAGSLVAGAAAAVAAIIVLFTLAEKGLHRVRAKHRRTSGPPSQILEAALEYSQSR